MKIVYTKHAQNKFKHPSIVKLKIKKSALREVLSQPGYILEDRKYGINIITRSIDESHSLRVVYKESDGIIIIITFHPAKKGRYEKRKN